MKQWAADDFEAIRKRRDELRNAGRPVTVPPMDFVCPPWQPNVTCSAPISCSGAKKCLHACYSPVASSAPQEDLGDCYCD
jgi:hypothetical protein